MTVFEVRRMGRTNLIVAYTAPRSFAHGGALDHTLIETVGRMDTDRLAAAVIEAYEARNSKQRRGTVSNCS
jgi:hypothetical protein